MHGQLKKPFLGDRLLTPDGHMPAFYVMLRFPLSRLTLPRRPDTHFLRHAQVCTIIIIHVNLNLTFKYAWLSQKAFLGDRLLTPDRPYDCFLRHASVSTIKLTLPRRPDVYFLRYAQICTLIIIHVNLNLTFKYAWIAQKTFTRRQIINS